MTQILEQGVPRLKDGIFVLIFPEGTRAEPHKLRRFQRGGALLAKEADMPLIPVSHNSGDYWLNKRFVKLPGTIDVIVHPPMAIGERTPEEATVAAQQQVAAGLAEIRGRRPETTGSAVGEGQAAR